MTDGFVMPAEWAPHRRTWIAWPHQRTDWPGKFEPIPWVAAEIVRHLTRDERVGILVGRDAPVRAVLRKAGADLRRVDFLRCATDRSWTRDSGPTFVRDRAGRRRAVCWRFNGWAKYPNWKRDRRVGAAIAGRAGVEAVDGGIVMEGGAIDVDGAGTLLATEECLLSRTQCRNPGLGRADYERVFAETLGVRRVVWLVRGIAGDDTHGHVDDVARFTAPGCVVLCGGHRRNRERLRAAKLEVVELPMPRPLFFDGVRVPASYANFYVANGRVLVPTFNDPADREALGLLAELFPGREIVGIHGVDFVWGFGTIHCATQQEPA